eukprot:708830-Rhodomonas_salina.1
MRFLVFALEELVAMMPYGNSESGVTTKQQSLPAYAPATDSPVLSERTLPLPGRSRGSSKRLRARGGRNVSRDRPGMVLWA